MAFGESDYDRAQQALDAQLAQQVRTFCRTRTWKQVARYLTDRQHDLETQLGQLGLGSDDRAMLQGKVAMVLEVRLQLPTAMVQESLGTPSTGEDVPDDPRMPGVQRPEMM